ncbi:MAG: SDR family oxidoreductase [Calditrichia bacterium]
MGKLLENYNCIITGGTGQLGMEVVKAFVKEGARVFLNYRDEKKFEQLQKEVGATGQLEGAPADLADELQVRRFFREFHEQYQQLDALLHLAGGFWMGGRVADTPLAQWRRMLEINLETAFLCMREAFCLMQEQGHGKIFTVSSKNAVELPPQMGAYATAKAALLTLSEIMAKEGKEYNIRVNCILPSIIDTPANRQGMPKADFQKWVSPAEIGNLLIQLCRPEAGSLSQTALKVYGQV